MLEIAALVATIVGGAVAVIKAVKPAKRFREWVSRRDQGRREWNARAATVHIEGSDEYFYQLTNENGTRARRRLQRSSTGLRRGNLLLLTETNRPASLTLKTEGEGTIILRTGWRRKNIKPGSTFELRRGFEEARIYMRTAKRLRKSDPSEFDLLHRVAEATEHGTRAAPIRRFLREGEDREEIESALKALAARGLVDLRLAYAGNVLTVQCLTLAGYNRLDEAERS